jgi:carboxymethylenebutenolidase
VRVTLPSGTPAELVRPHGDGATAGLVVAPDIFGLRPLFDGHVSRLAGEQGWAVVAVEPFPGREAMTLEDRFAAMPALDDEAQVGDLVAAADLLDVGRVAILGFCMGGMYAMKAAATGRFQRAVPFYGMIRVPPAWQGPKQRDAIDLLRESGMADRVLAIVATEDPWVPPSDADDLESAGATVVRYEGAEHGFVHDPDRPAHRAADAADAWERALAWLGGVSEPGG